MSKRQYEDVHRFLRERKWAPAPSERGIGGVTWTELFVLFDVSGTRSHDGEHMKDIKAYNRAQARSSKKKEENTRKPVTWHQ